MTVNNKLLTALWTGAALCAVGGASQAAVTPTASAFEKVGTAQPGAQPGSAAGALVVELTGTPSIDGLDNALNVRWVLDAAPGALVDTIDYQATLSTWGASWLSEATVQIANSAGQGVRLRPGFGTDAEGTASFSGSASLRALDMAFNVGTDGKLNFQFFEDYDDVAGSIDAVFTAGSITLGGVAVTPVPEPATYGLMSLGLLGIAGAARARRKVV